MKLNQHFKDWKQIISHRFPHLSLPQVSGLATWSFGMVMTQSSSLSKVSTLISKVNQEPENTVRQRLKEWYKSGSAKAKKGNKRASIEVTECFGSLLRWIIYLLPQNNEELLIAMDATNISLNFTVLSINVLYRRSAILVAWKVVKGTSKGSWKPHWKKLFQALKNIVPKNQSWSGRITCFKSNPIDCTLLARWDDGYVDPWLILTNLESENADVSWYGFRSWIECSYRDIKSDGWQWHKRGHGGRRGFAPVRCPSRLRQPDRAERHWLAMSVAMLWMVVLGGEQEISDDEQLVSDRLLTRKSTPTRQITCFLNGLLTVVARLLNGQSITFGRLFPLSFNHFHDLHFADSS